MKVLETGNVRANFFLVILLPCHFRIFKVSKIFDHENSWILNKKFLELCVEFGILSRDRIKSGWFSILIFGEKLKLCKDPEWKPI